MPNRGHILVADGDPACRKALQEALESEGMHIHCAASGAEAIDLLKRSGFELVILDLKLPDRGGLDVLQKVVDGRRDTPVIVIARDPTVEEAVAALKCGAVDLVCKPCDDEKVRAIVRKVLAHTRVERAHRRMHYNGGRVLAPPKIVGRAPAMRKVMGLVRRVAPTDSTVLIMGESGTGKELIARALHHASNRARGPFVVVDCATLMGMLFENELFGHVKGSYTGATTTTHGRFGLADGGTLFLDEVGCMDTNMQQKLLRVLEQREFTRVGSNQVISIDVRVIAATNTDLTAAVKRGAFREDLYYRLSVFPIVLPPLRKRRADVPLLAEHFLDLHCEQRQKDVASIDDGAMTMLLTHHWPGNVRELSNAIERAVVLAEDHEVLPEHLLHYAGSSVPLDVAYGPRTPSLAEMERAHIERVLAHADGNKRLAAELLCIDRKTLWRKLRQYDAAAH